MNAELRVVLSILASYYRRFPLQGLFLLTGLVLGVVMISGIHAINERARASYAEADAAFGQQEQFRIENIQPLGTLPQSLFAELRRTGFDASLPVLEGSLLTAGGQRLRVTGVDPLSLPLRASGFGHAAIDLAAFISPPFEALLGRRQADRIGIGDGQMLTLEGGRELGPVHVVEDEPLLGNRLLMDVGAAQHLLRRSEQLSWISLFDLPDERRAELESMLPEQARLTRMNDPDELAQLTDSFHLNLTAMSLLAFIVGLFIVYNAVNYTVLQRRPLISRMRLLGISRRAASVGIAVEMTVWVLLGTAIGFGGGLLLADLLSPTVTDTLDNLYRARLVPEDTVRWTWFVEALLVTLAGTFVASARQLWRLGRTPPVRAQTASAEQRNASQDHRLQGAVAVLLTGLGALFLAAGQGLTAGFAAIACTLLAAALVLPALLSGLATGLERLARRRSRPRWALLGWACADARARMGRLGIAMMAFLLAMATNVGINTMVGSFRLTFQDWIEQRLSAQLYIRPAPEQAEPIMAWLRAQPGVSRVAGYRETLGLADGRRAEIVGMDIDTLRDSQVFRDGQRDGVWEALTKGDVLISERLALDGGLSVGDQIQFGDDSRRRAARVAGVVYDYGNPRGRLYMQERQWLALWPGIPPQSIGAYFEPDQSLDTERLRQHFDLAASQLIDQASVKALSLDIFERTFTITRAMNGLTLIVAGIGLLCALLATEGFRLRELAQVRALGVPIRELRRLGAVQIGGLALVTAVLSIPLGILLAWQLVNVVNVAAFGWSFPLRLFPGDYARLTGLAVVVALLAAAWPSWRQSRASCSRWLQAETG